MTKIRAFLLAIILAVTAVCLGANEPASAQTVVSCNSYVIAYTFKTFSTCFGMAPSQTQQAVALCQGFSWTQGYYTYFRVGNRARNGIQSVAVCDFGGAVPIGSSWIIN